MLEDRLSIFHIKRDATHVTVRDDASIWSDTRTIVERYVPAPDVEARLQQLRTQNRVIIDFTPERVLFRA